MIITTPAFILGVKPLGENGVMVTVFSETEGKIRGLVKGARKKRADLQLGNIGTVTWARRLEDQLGTFRWEPQKHIGAKYLDDYQRLQALQSMMETLRIAFPDGAADLQLYQHTLHVIQNLSAETYLTDIALWELNLLTTLGYGLSLTEEGGAVPCTHGSPYTHVSPNTGRAVSEVMAQPYKDKLLPLPALFGGPMGGCEFTDIRLAFRLTGFFLKQAVHEQPLTARETFLSLLANTVGDDEQVMKVA